MRCSLVFALALSFVSSAVAAPLAVSAAPADVLVKRNCYPMPSKVDPKIRDFLYTYVRSKTKDDKILKIVMTTAITESFVNNLNCGDQESHGIFQQKAPGYGWGTVAQTMDPAHATDAFLAALMKIYPNNKGLPVNVLAQKVQQAEAGDYYKNNMDRADQLIAEARKSTGDNGNNDAPAPSSTAPKPTSTKTPKPTSSSAGNGGAINVPVPAPTSTSTPDNGNDDEEDCDDSLPACDKFYVPVSGDNCYKVAGKFGLSLSDFYKLNADLDSECQNLYAGQKYCVAASDVNN